MPLEKGWRKLQFYWPKNSNNFGYAAFASSYPLAYSARSAFSSACIELKCSGLLRLQHKRLAGLGKQRAGLALALVNAVTPFLGGHKVWIFPIDPADQRQV